MSDSCTIGNGAFWLGDCLDLMRHIPDGSVDMVLCDLPYGTTACKWDQVIPFEPLWSHYWRVCKPNAAIVLTASQPFTSALVMSQPHAFKYCWVWAKNKVTGHLNADQQPMREHEDICIFYKKQSVYNPVKTLGFTPNSYVQKSDKIGVTDVYGSQSGGRKGNGSYERNPRSIQFFSVERGLHPTQKPEALFDYLIRTYTNSGDLVLDNCAGSGTTAVAAQLSGRRWLCIEREPMYYYPAVGRVWKAAQNV